MLSYWSGVATLTGIYLIATLGVSILVGFTGLFSLGHAGFMAIGAYGTALSIKLLHMPFFPACLMGILAAMLAGGLIGRATLRLKGDYFVIATLAIGECTKLLIENIPSITGGSRGLTDIPKKTSLLLVWVILLAVIVILSNFLHSKHGRNCIAVREEELAAKSIGIDVIRYKMLAFLISCALCGLAGGLLAGYMGYLYHHAVIGSCGKVLIRAVAHGKAAHAAEAESGINAINEMSKFLSVLERVPLQTSEVMPAQPYITLRVRGGSNRYSMVVPDSCEALISKHTVPGETPEKIIVDLQSAVQREKLHASFEFAVEKPFYPSFLLNDNLEEICRLRHIFEEVTGEELKLVCSDGVSDNNHWSTIGGIPSVCFGPGGKGLHQSDEWVSTEQMENVLEVYLRFFLEDEE